MTYDIRTVPACGESIWRHARLCVLWHREDGHDGAWPYRSSKKHERKMHMLRHRGLNRRGYYWKSCCQRC